MKYWWSINEGLMKDERNIFDLLMDYYWISNELLLIFASTYLFRFVSANYGVLITAKDKQKIRVYATSILVVVTVVSTIILTKSMGIIGAAYANAISYFIIIY